MLAHKDYSLWGKKKFKNLAECGSILSPAYDLLDNKIIPIKLMKILLIVARKKNFNKLYFDRFNIIFN
jgi:hypothetical protein